MAALGLRCCMPAFSSFDVQRFSLQCLVAEHSLEGTTAQQLQLQALERRLNSGSTWAWLLHSMWDLPSPRSELVSSTSAGRFLTTGPPGKSSDLHFFLNDSLKKYS